MGVVLRTSCSTAVEGSAKGFSSQVATQAATYTQRAGAAPQSAHERVCYSSTALPHTALRAGRGPGAALGRNPLQRRCSAGGSGRCPARSHDWHRAPRLPACPRPPHAPHASGCAQPVVGAAGLVRQCGAAALGQRSVHPHHAEPAADHRAAPPGGRAVPLPRAALAQCRRTAHQPGAGAGQRRVVAERRRHPTGGLAARGRQESARQPQGAGGRQQPAGHRAEGGHPDRAGRHREQHHQPTPARCAAGGGGAPAVQCA